MSAPGGGTGSASNQSGGNHSASPRWTGADRRALAAVATQFFVNGAAVAVYVPRLPEIRTRVGVDVTQLGIVLALAGLVAVVTSTVVGHINERLGTRRAIVVGGIFMMAGLMAIGFSTHPIALGLSIGLFQSSDAVVDVAMNLQGSWLSARRPVPAMNRLHAMWSVGTLVSGFITSRVAAAGVSVPQYTVIAAVALMGIMLVLSRSLLPADEVHADVDSALEVLSDVRGPSLKTLLPFAVAGVCAVAFEVLPMDWSAFRFVDDFGSTAGFAALGFVAATVGMTSARVVGDSIVARIGSDRMLSISLWLIAVGFVLATLVPNRYAALFGYMVIGLGAAAVMPKMYDDAARRKGKPGAGIGALSSGIRIGGLSLPLIVGGLAGTSLSVGQASAIAGAVSLAMFIVIRPLVKAQSPRRGVAH